MLSDLLLLAGLVLGVVACFMLAVVLGVFALAAVLVVLGLALADGDGGPWRARS